MPPHVAASPKPAAQLQARPPAKLRDQSRGADLARVELTVGDHFKDKRAADVERDGRIFQALGERRWSVVDHALAPSDRRSQMAAGLKYARLRAPDDRAIDAPPRASAFAQH